MGFGIAVVGYIGLLYFGATIVPGVGLSGYLIGLVPWILFDWAHAPGYGILALLLTRGLQRRAWPLAYALPVAAAAAFVFGLWTEVFQGSVQGRQTTADDLVTDAIGIGLAAMILMLFETVRNRIVSSPLALIHFLRSGVRALLSLSLVEPNKPVRPDRPDRPNQPDPRHAPRNGFWHHSGPSLSFDPVDPVSSPLPHLWAWVCCPRL